MEEYEEVCPYCNGKVITINKYENYDLWAPCIFCNNGKIDWISKLKINKLISSVDVVLKE